MLFFLHIAAKNGVYLTLVRDVRNAFEGSSLVKVNCKGMHASDYKKLGAKLKVCVQFLFIYVPALYLCRGLCLILWQIFTREI